MTTDKRTKLGSKKLGDGIDLPGALGFRVWSFAANLSMQMERAHSHADFELNFLSQGHVRYAFAGQIVTVAAGSLALFWGSIPHLAIDTSDDAKGFWATLPLTLVLSWNLPKKLDDRMLRGEFVTARATEAIATNDRLLLSRWPEDYQRKDPELRRTLLLEIEARIRRLAHDSAAPTSRGAVKRPEPGIESALAFLHKHYLDDIQAEDAGAAAGWHPKYLMRQFKQTLNMTVGEYLMRLRISHAQWLLISTEKSMLDVAFDSGYQSLAPFYQAFRKVAHGTTPLQFRKNARKGKVLAAE